MTPWVLVVFTLLVGYSPQTPVLSQVCPDFLNSDSGLSHTSTQEVELSPEQIVEFLTLPVRGEFWVGYEYGGFAWPDDSLPVLTSTFWEGPVERWIDIFYSPQTPDRYYVLPYESIETVPDSQGEHLGQHPCRAIWITPEDFHSLFTQLFP